MDRYIFLSIFYTIIAVKKVYSSSQSGLRNSRITNLLPISIYLIKQELIFRKEHSVIYERQNTVIRPKCIAFVLTTQYNRGRK